MATVKWETAEDYLKSLTGIDTFTAQEKSWLKSGFNRHVRMAYEESDYWPRYLKEENRYADFDNVIPTQQDGYSEIDTFNDIQSVSPRNRATTVKRYDWVTRSDGAKLLNLAEGSYLEEQYEATENTGTSGVIASVAGTARSISFWMKWSGDVDYDSSTDADGNPRTVGGQHNLLITSPDSTFDGGITIKSAVGPAYGMGTRWGRGVSEFANWWVDGVYMGTMQDHDIATKNISTYLDGEWHLFCISQDYASTETITVDNIRWELGSTGDNVSEFTFGDWRIYSNKLTSADALTLYNSPAGAINNPIIWASNRPEYWVSYKAALTAKYGDSAGETEDIPLEFFEYGVHGAYADWLRAEGQTDKARVEEAFAREHLERQLEKIGRTNGSPYLWSRFSTHATRQGR